MEDNKKAISNLAQTCIRSGILPVVLGLCIIFVGVVEADYKDMIIGIFMFIVGYSFYKIGNKIKKYSS